MPHRPYGNRDSPTPTRVGESLTRLTRVAGELSSADTVEAVTKIVTHHMADAVGATIAVLALREGGRAKLLGLRGLPIRETVRWEVIPVGQHTPPTGVMRTGARLVLAGEAAITRAYSRPTRHPAGGAPSTSSATVGCTGSR